ncbi:latent transforming growth factor beta-binding protein [Pyxidicoccus caerfyrddinensis]|uniref:latent transforming growth factor beta-binding protein n=1 Tax=Pyxidicoccus caerfyrddinensis TaxID=2709663 RepID=UPI0013DCCCA7|nr:latent transforming growth factor beta-binding protein [Pyxidicoccus caerfyrddinensis]
MHPPVSWFLVSLGLLMVLGCPLDIQVRPEEGTDAGCQGKDCETLCVADSECPESHRCDDFEGHCAPGPRLTEECSDFISCQGLASCEDGRCELRCASYECPPGYQCGPDKVCVETCTGGPPETLGAFCDSSLDCTRCGFCVDGGGSKRCHQPCSSDGDCPGGAVGSCQAVPGGSLHVCRLP